MNLALLEIKISKICPCEGVFVDGATSRIDFLPEATGEQRAAAQAIFDNWEDPLEQNWKAFVDDAASVAGFYGAIAGSAMASLITARMVRLAAGEEFKGASDPLINVWNAAPPVLDATQRSELQALADANNIPATIAADNLLTAT